MVETERKLVYIGLQAARGHSAMGRRQAAFQVAPKSFYAVRVVDAFGPLFNFVIHSYVLEDETRVLSLRGLQSGVGLSEGGGKEGVRKIPALMSRLKQKGLNVMELDARANSPFRFVTTSGAVADGYDARILPDICAVLIEAHRRKFLDARVERLGERAALLQHGFATLGIIALVDRATGYQDFKTGSEMARIIEAFVAKALQPWVKKFPSDYYAQMCRLRGLLRHNPRIEVCDFHK